MINAELDWTNELQMIARVDDGAAVVMDTPDGGSGPSPMDLVLMGVAGCSAMDVVSILKKKRSSFTGLKIRITGERAEDHPKRYTRINLAFAVTGKGVKEKDVARAIELSITKYCSAAGSVNAEITHSFEVVDV